jgi:hypothetical protein
MSSLSCLCVCEFLPIFMKCDTYIAVPEPTSTAYYINPSHHYLYLYVYLPIVSRQRLGKNVTAATNTHATIELLDALSCQRQVVY